MLVHIAQFILMIYRKCISPLILPRCRFYPTCSTYAVEALNIHGFNGFKLILKRILSCRPFGGYGYDPVPKNINISG